VLNFTAIDLQLYKKCESHFWETYSSLKKILHNCQHAARHHNQCTACSITLTCCHRDAVHHSVLSVRHAASQASPHYAARQICKSCNYNERTGAISHHYYNTTTVYSCCKGNCRTASTDCPRRKYGRNTLSRQTKKQWLNDIEDWTRYKYIQLKEMSVDREQWRRKTRHQPSEEEGRLERG